MPVAPDLRRTIGGGIDAARPHRYTAEQRAAALELYSEVGPAEAGRRLGIPSGTVRSWARRNGCAAVATENRRAAVEAARLTWEQRRSGLTVRLGEVAAELLERVEKTEPGEAKALSLAIAILVDKAEFSRAERRREARPGPPSTWTPRSSA